MRLALVVLPYDTELEDPFGDLNDLKGFLVGWVGCEEGANTERELSESLYYNQLLLEEKENKRGTCSNSGSEGKTMLDG